MGEVGRPLLALFLSAAVTVLDAGAALTAQASTAQAAVRAMEFRAAQDFTASQSDILNWSPFGGSRYDDSELGIVEHANPRVRGTGGLIKARWSDFRVMERSLDGSDAVLTDIRTLPDGEDSHVRFVLLKVAFPTNTQCDGAWTCALLV